MAIGPTLREAREQKQLTASQVAEMTRMKVQIVDDLEHDDFHRIAATIYGKGFIKMYAECVDIAPEPLIEDYLSQVGKAPPPKLPAAEAQQSDEVDSPGAEEAVDKEEPREETTEDDLFSYASKPHKTKRATSTTRAESATASAQEQIQNGFSFDWKNIIVSCASFVRKTTKAMREKSKEWVQQIKKSGISEKWIVRCLVGLGILVLLLILIPIGRSILTAFEPDPLPDDKLILLIDPPEPYLD